MEPTTTDLATTGGVSAIGGAILMKILDKIPFGKLIGKTPEKRLSSAEIKSLVRMEAETMIREHDENATNKTKLLIHDHENCCLNKIDQRFREHAQADMQWRSEETAERREFRREMLESTKRMHERLDALVGAR